MTALVATLLAVGFGGIGGGIAGWLLRGAHDAWERQAQTPSPVQRFRTTKAALAKAGALTRRTP